MKPSRDTAIASKKKTKPARRSPLRLRWAWPESGHSERRQTTPPAQELATPLQEPQGLLLTGIPSLIAADRLADHEKKELYSAISHSFRTPLVGANGYLDYLFSGYAGPLATEQLSQLGSARDSVLQLQRVIDIFLDICAFDLGLVELALEKLEIQPFLESLGLDELVGAENHKLSIKTPPDPLWISADARWLRVLLYELASNAIRVSPANSELGIHLSKQGDTVTLSVTDHGPGAPANRLQWIFQTFAQLRRKGDPPKGERGGLGLPLVWHIAKAHGWSIWVGSGRGYGLTISLRMPALSSK